MIEEKRCGICKELKPVSEFYRSGKRGYQSYCKPCHGAKVKEWTKSNTEKTQAKGRKTNLRRYNLSPEDYEKRLLAQGGVCAICGHKPQKIRLSVDHDHSCCPGKSNSCGKCIRGLLCRNCNFRLLGQICRESTKGTEHALEILRKAGDYLRKATETADS